MSLLRRLAAKPLRLALQAAGRVYVPGHTLEDALAIARPLAADGIACTLGYFHGNSDSPAGVARAAMAIAAAVAELDPPGYLSLKAPALGYDLGLLGAVLGEARTRGVLAHFDSHEHPTAEPTLRCVEHAAGLGSPVGLTIPGRWQRSPDDAEFAARLGVRVRVVKGEWGDPTAPGLDPRQGFLAVVDRLAGTAPEAAVATHDPWLARQALARLQAAGTRCELELLNGLPRRDMLAIAREFGVPVRLYIPFGIAWRPYALGKAADNPRILWWILRDTASGLLLRLRP